MGEGERRDASARDVGMGLDGGGSTLIISTESMEGADLVPYLLVDERARGLFFIVARISIYSREGQTSGAVLFSLRFLRRVVGDTEPSVRSVSSSSVESALRLDEDATTVAGVDFNNSLDGGIVVALAREVGEPRRGVVESTGSRRRFAGGGREGLDWCRVLARTGVASNARRLERLTFKSG